MTRRKLLRVLLTGVFCLAFLGAWKLWTANRHRAADLTELRLDPLGRASLRTSPLPALSRQTPLLVILGDSRAQAWTTLHPTGWTVVNHGMTGQTTAQILGRYLIDIRPAKPDLLLVQVGVNDLSFDRGSDALNDESLDNVIANMTTLLDAAQADGTHVILTTCFGVRSLPLRKKVEWPKGFETRLAAYNVYLKSRAGPGVDVVDASAALSPPSTNDTSSVQVPEAAVMADYIHLNDKGYARLNDLVQPLIARITPGITPR